MTQVHVLTLVHCQAARGWLVGDAAFAEPFAHSTAWLPAEKLWVSNAKLVSHDQILSECIRAFTVA